MFDTMTLTKAVGAVCGALLIYLFVVWAAESIYGSGEKAYGAEEVAQAYSVDTGVAETTEVSAAADGGADFAVVFASADAAAGEKVAGKCKACHKFDGANATGPHLNGVVGRNMGSVDGFGYSDAMKALSADIWTPEAMNAFLTNPKGVVKGTKMTFVGLAKIEDRANVIAYLASLQ